MDIRAVPGKRIVYGPALIVLLVALLALSMGFDFFRQNTGQNPFEARNVSYGVLLGNITITAEVADTPELQAYGLMFRGRLDEGDGMLFVFGSEGHRSFWMKNTLLPLDIIWIDKDLGVVHIEEAEPCNTSFCAYYSSPLPAEYVVEVSRGFSERHNVTVGSYVSIKR